MNRYKNQNKVTLFKVRSGITREAYDPFSGEFKGGGGTRPPSPKIVKTKLKHTPSGIKLITCEFYNYQLFGNPGDFSTVD